MQYPILSPSPLGVLWLRRVRLLALIGFAVCCVVQFGCGTRPSGEAASSSIVPSTTGLHGTLGTPEIAGVVDGVSFPVGQFGPPPPIPHQFIAGVWYTERGVIFGRIVESTGLSVDSPYHLGEITIGRDGVMWVDAEWPDAMHAAPRLFQTWTSNPLIAGGAVSSSDFDEELTFLDADLELAAADFQALSVGTVVTGRTSYGYVREVRSNVDGIRIEWMDPRSCERTHIEVAPIYVLFPDSTEPPSAAIVMFERGGRYCSLALEASDSRLAFTFEPGCTDDAAFEGVVFSGALAPTEIEMPPMLESCSASPQDSPDAGVGIDE